MRNNDRRNIFIGKFCVVFSFCHAMAFCFSAPIGINRKRMAAKANAIFVQYKYDKTNYTPFGRYAVSQTVPGFIWLVTQKF